jgi:uncharacterized protein (TIGR03435 family)
MIEGSTITLGQLGSLLSPRVGRPVEDHTGLTGTFYARLEWTPDAGAEPPSDTVRLSDDRFPFLFTALREQLGLKLESTKGRLDVLVIDHVERPAPN